MQGRAQAIADHRLCVQADKRQVALLKPREVGEHASNQGISRRFGEPVRGNQGGDDPKRGHRLGLPAVNIPRDFRFEYDIEFITFSDLCLSLTL